MEVLKAHVNAGLVPRRTDCAFDMGAYDGYLEGAKSRSEKIRMLIRAGVYDINRAGVVDTIAADWYKTPDAKTPERVVKEERRRKDALPTKPPRPCPLAGMAKVPQAVRDAKRPDTRARRLKMYIMKTERKVSPADMSSPALKEPRQRYMPKVAKVARAPASAKVPTVSSKLVQGGARPHGPSRIIVV